MKFLAFSDSHRLNDLYEEIVSRSVVENVSLLVSVGDFTSQGRLALENITYLSQSGLPLFLVPGNHEYSSDIIQEVTQKFSFVKDIDGIAKTLNGVTFFGCGAADWYWGNPKFINPDGHPEFVLSLKNKLKRDSRPKVFLTHCPPSQSKAGTTPQGQDSGSAMIRNIIETIVPDLALCGHIHSPLSREDKIGNTCVVNVACRCAIFEVIEGKIKLVPLLPKNQVLDIFRARPKKALWQKLFSK